MSSRGLAPQARISHQPRREALYVSVMTRNASEETAGVLLSTLRIGERV